LKQLVSLAAITARKLGCDKSEETFRRAFTRIAPTSERQNRAEKMPYYLYMRAAGGTETKLDRAYNSIEDAMSPACGALRAHGITDAWVVDENGMKHADLEAIKEYCSQKT
jgi:hypothetical protein